MNKTITLSDGTTEEVIKVRVVNPDSKLIGKIFNVMLSRFGGGYRIIDDGEHWMDFIYFEECIKI